MAVLRSDNSTGPYRSPLSEATAGSVGTCRARDLSDPLLRCTSNLAASSSDRVIPTPILSPPLAFLQNEDSAGDGRAAGISMVDVSRGSGVDGKAQLYQGR